MWICTYSGRQFDPFNLKPDDIQIEDIAHALALTCRFGGHVKSMYSVAQHCVIGALELEKTVGKGAAKVFLLHDASEAYLTDLARPFKMESKLGEHYREWEYKLQQAIYNHYGVSELLWHDEIKRMDNCLCITEKRDLLVNSKYQVWEGDWPDPLPYTIVPWTWEEAEYVYYETFNRLFKNENN